jgi:protein O-GlcNAc transferase
VPTRESVGLPSEGFVYACFNRIDKIEPQVFEAWMTILKSVPGSVLWLFNSHATAVAHLISTAENAGVDGGRLVFAERLPKPQHLARHALADLFLDTLHYNAHTTATDAMFTGLPVLTFPGMPPPEPTW